jgi:formate hydrogenlyase transcriptional activator
MNGRGPSARTRFRCENMDTLEMVVPDTHRARGVNAQVVDRLRFEKMIADISSRFVDVPADRVDEEILAAQGRLCACLDVELSSVWQPVNGDLRVMQLTHLHQPPSRPPRPVETSGELFPWVAGQVLAGRIVAICSTAATPPEADRDRQTWERFGIKSSLSLPLSAGGGPVIGVLSFATIARELDWPEPVVNRCRLIAGVFANALTRKRSEQALRASEDRYRTITQNLPGIVYQFYVRDDGKWGLHYIDPRAGDLCGLSPTLADEFFDRFTDHIAPEDCDGWLASIRDSIGRMGKWDHECRYLKPSGEEIFIRGISEPRRVGDEIVFCGVLCDVTERRRARDELRRTLDELNRLKEQLQHENVYLRKEVHALQGQSPIVGDSEPLRSVLEQAQRVAATDSTVLILGETGTGKELLASYLHRIGRRSGKAFITMNIAAIPSTLLESELFGREKGAYTGALTKQIGRFEMADGGTLFLDEVGEMPLETQAKLLRVLQRGEFERLGSGQTLRADVQLIAATNRKLPELIREGKFRQDLYYRLNVFPITLPPLRDRPRDIPLLV